MFTATFHTLSLRNSSLNWLAPSLSELLYEKLPNNPAPSLLLFPKLPGAKRSLSWGFKLLEARSFLLIHRIQNSKWVFPRLCSSAWSMDADRLNSSHACSFSRCNPCTLKWAAPVLAQARPGRLPELGEPEGSAKRKLRNRCNWDKFLLCTAHESPLWLLHLPRRED